MPKKAVFLTDSLSALQALMSGEPDTLQMKLTENISTLARSVCIFLQWIPAHTGIIRNETGDQREKEGREEELPQPHLSYREVKTLIRYKKESHLPKQDWMIPPKPGLTPSPATTPTNHTLWPQNRPLQTEQPSQQDWHKYLSSMPLWRSGPITRTWPAILLTIPPSKAAYMTHLCVPESSSSWGLRRICSWHSIMRHSRERGSSQRNHHIERKRRRRANPSDCPSRWSSCHRKVLGLRKLV